MKIDKIQMLIIICITLIIGIILGTNLSNFKDGKFTINDLNPLPNSCQYYGEVYRNGDRFPSDDGCNTCSCQDGRIACTLMACEPN